MPLSLSVSLCTFLCHSPSLHKATGRLCNSEEIIIRGVNLTENYRDAMSVTGAVNLMVEDSILAKTGVGGGTCCNAGVDLEPETPFRSIRNVSFRNCIFEENVPYFHISHPARSAYVFPSRVEYRTGTAGLKFQSDHNV